MRNYAAATRAMRLKPRERVQKPTPWAEPYRPLSAGSRVGGKHRAGPRSAPIRNRPLATGPYSRDESRDECQNAIKKPLYSAA